MTWVEAALLGLLAHGAGDYVVQSDWMAAEKTRRWWPALAHALTYTLPFLLITRHLGALAVIAVTHAVIDRYRLARHVVWAKNQLAPARYRYPWAHATATGYHPDQCAAGCDPVVGKPAYMAVWLMILADNLAHVSINCLALWWAVS